MGLVIVKMQQQKRNISSFMHTVKLAWGILPLLASRALYTKRNIRMYIFNSDHEKKMFSTKLCETPFNMTLYRSLSQNVDYLKKEHHLSFYVLFTF